MEIKNILVPIDFSACSKNALKKAIIIAKQTKAKIHMVNAVHIHTPHAIHSSAMILESLISDYEAQVKQSFEELESELIELNDVPHEADRFITYLTDAIHAELANKSIDLIIMGTRDQHDGLDHFIGTNASDIIEGTNVPVMVVPEHHVKLGINKIAFAMDLHKITDLGSLEVLQTIAKIYDAEVLAFHVETPPFEVSSIEEKRIHALKEKLEGVEYSFRTVEADDVEEGIRNFIAQHEIDLLAMMPRKHNFFERLFSSSMTKNIAFASEVPLLAFHDV